MQRIPSRTAAMAMALGAVLAAPAFAADCADGTPSASGSCTVPAGAISVTVEAWGGGGGGAGGQSSAFGGSGGGGGGAYCKATLSVAGSTPLTVTVGAAA